MARRTKAQLVEFEVETALEEALDINFDEEVFADDALDAENDIIDLDDLAKQIAQATEEVSASTEKKASSGSVVDDSVAEQLFKKTSSSTAIPAGTVKAPVVAEPFQPANDDRSKLRANKIKTKTSHTLVYLSTTALSALWAIGGIAFAYRLSPNGLASLQDAGSFLFSPVGAAVTAGTVLPIAMFWGFAQLTKRAKELQAVVRSISEAAARLTEPDKESEARVIKLGQTVRHEISMMGEGLERTISRAAELEALVQGEVQNLERAYNENETRIHNLIKELNAEREAILGHADRVKHTIRTSQDQLAGEFGAITSNIAQNVQEITATLSDTVKGNGDELIQRIHSAGDEITQKISNRVDVHTSDLATSLEKTTDKALNSFEEKFKNFDEKIVDRANRSVVDFDERVNTLVNRTDSIASAFDSATEQAIHAFEERLSKMDSMLGERSNSMIHSFIARAHSLDSNAEKIGEALNERVTYINTTLKERTKEIAKTFETGYSQINGALKQRVDDISEAFNGGNNEINETLRKHIDDISQTVGSNYQQLNSVLHNRLQEIATSFEGGNSQLTDALNEHTERMSKTFGLGYEQISDSLQKTSDEIIKNFEGKNELVSENLKARVAEIEHIFENGFRYIDDTMNQRIKDITQSIVGSQGIVDDSLKMRLTEIVDTFERNRDEISNVMRERVFEIARAFDGGHNDIKTTLEDYASEVARAFEGERFNISALVENVADRLSIEVDKVDDTVSKALDKRADVFMQHLNEGREMIEAAMQDGGNGIIQSVEKQLQSLSTHVDDIEKTLLQNIQMFDQYTINHGETLSNRTLDLTKTIENSVLIARDVLDTQMKNIDVRADALRDSLNLNSSALNEVLADQAHVLEERIEKIRDLLSNSDIKFSEVVNSQVYAVETVMNQSKDILNFTFDEHLHSLTNHTNMIKSVLTDSTKLHSSLDATTDKLQDVFTTQGAIIEGRTAAIQQVLETGAEQLRASMENGAAIVSEGLNERVNHAVETFASKIQNASTIADEIENKLQQTAISLESGVEQTSHVLANETNRIAETFQDKLDRVTVGVSDKIWDSGERIVAIGTEATKLIEQAAFSIESKLADRSAFLSSAAQQVELNVNDHLRDIGERLSTITNDHFSNVSDQIEHMNKSSQTLMSAAAKTGQSFGALSDEFAARLTETTNNLHEELRKGNDDLTTAFSKRVAETIAAIHSTESNVQQNFGSIFNNVNVLLEQLNQSVKNIQYCSGDLISEIADIDGKFNATAQSFYNNVGEVRKNLAQSSNVLTENVEHLRNISNNTIGQMEAMGRHFTEHSALLEQASGMLDDSQNSFTTTIENRQKALHVLSNGLAAKSDEVAEVIRHYSDTLIATMQDTQQRSKQSAIEMQQELAALVEKASTKFEKATEEIRKNANEVRSEISSVSSDINNSIQTLPVQTRQSTKVMREAIADQISALKELTGLLNHSSSMSDVSQAMEFPGDVFAYRKTERTPEKDTVAPSFIDTVGNRKEKKHSSWVSELLARASRDDKEETDSAVATKTRTMAKTTESESALSDSMIESLNTLSMDIVRAINHNAIVELWSHYHRDQRNISTQRLYTMSGQKTYEKIKDKYMQNRDFRRSVSQYITDFERLLREIQESDGKDAVRDYLISDTGKVYTMLAHISGRIQ